jgi:protocatechuate 3,4-dioxygenase beta subunit
MSHKSRRRFLQNLAWMGGAAGLMARRLASEEPFDSLPASVWKNARENGLVMIHRPAPAHISWRTRIAPAGEPGEPLLVDGQVFAPDGRTPAPGVTVYAYNTDAQGYYGENHKEYPPRLYGWMKTDATGRFELQTIRPGRYPGMHVPAHIHFELWGAGYPLQWVDVLLFAGDSYLTPQEIQEDAGRGEFRTIQALSRGGDGLWHCRYKMKLVNHTTFH